MNYISHVLWTILCLQLNGQQRGRGLDQISYPVPESVDQPATCVPLTTTENTKPVQLHGSGVGG